jgi:hypothetical protein
MEIVIGNGDDSFCIGGESEYVLTELISSYKYLSEPFNKLRQHFLNSVEDKNAESIELKKTYMHERSIYQSKLMEMFSLNATDLESFDEELYELCIIDDYSLAKLIIHRHNIFEKNMINALDLLIEKIKKKYKVNEQSKKHKNVSHHNLQSYKKKYIEKIFLFKKLIDEIPESSFKIPEFNYSDDNNVVDKNVSSNKELPDRYCDACIHNRIFTYVEYIVERMQKIKPLLNQLEESILKRASYISQLIL